MEGWISKLQGGVRGSARTFLLWITVRLLFGAHSFFFFYFQHFFLYINAFSFSRYHEWGTYRKLRRLHWWDETARKLSARKRCQVAWTTEGSYVCVFFSLVSQGKCQSHVWYFLKVFGTSVWGFHAKMLMIFPFILRWELGDECSFFISVLTNLFE